MVSKLNNNIKVWFLIVFITQFSCNYAQTNEHSGKSMNQETYTEFTIDTIAEIKKTEAEKSPAFIKKRLEQLIGKSFRNRCAEIGLQYPPKFVLFRFFKLESQFEIWAGNAPNDSLRLLALLPVCAADNEPGTKLKEGDGKTPEGFFKDKILYGSQYNFMWIKLNTSDINNFGQCNKGASFRLCLDYPTSIDQRRTTKFLSPQTSPGSAICIHGNCVTAGCISFKNNIFLPVFLAALYHDRQKFGAVDVHIFPFRFTDELIDKYSHEADSHLSPEEWKSFWKQLQKGCELFDQTHRTFRVEFLKDTYLFKDR